MIDRVGSKPQVTTEAIHVEGEPKETTSVKAQEVQEERSSSPSGQQAAMARKNEMSLTGSTQRAMLSAQLQSAASGKSGVEVAAGAPPVSDTGSSKTLQLGDKGKEVSDMQYDLLTWQIRNNIPSNVGPNGVFTEDTQKSLAEFQLANGLFPSGKADANTRLRLQLESHLNFHNLDSGVKDTIRLNMSRFSNDPAAQKNLIKLVTDEKFGTLSTESQFSALAGFMMHPADNKHLKNVQEAVGEVLQLEKEKALDQLPREIKEQVISTTFKKTENKVDGIEMDDPAYFRKQIAAMARKPEFAALTSAQQSMILKAINDNPDPERAGQMNEIITSPGFAKLSPKVKDEYVHLLHDTCVYHLYKEGDRTRLAIESNNRFYDAKYLKESSHFLKASEEDQLAQLKAMRPPMPGDSNSEIPILA